ncbi:MAG: plasmid pRiA4b ORF-3 family protein, partial [Bacteroidales bacterium]
ELEGISPTIWRRIRVTPLGNFWDLHVAIQDAMGWTDHHLHHFEIRKKGKREEDHLGIPDFDRIGEVKEVYPGWEIPIFQYFVEFGTEAFYHYDYGDGWVHRIKLEGYMYREKGVKYPICVEGERACPPEDCGGVYGYQNLLQVLADPEDEEYESTNIWVGEEWEPEAFHPDEVVFDNPYKRWVYAFLKA